MTLAREEQRPHDRIETWLRDSLNTTDSESLWRARLILVAWALVFALALFSISLQLLRGSPTAAAIGAVFLLAFLAIPLLLRQTGSIVITAHCLAGEFFVVLTAVNLASAGNALAAALGLVLVPVLAFLAPGRVGPCLWALLVCAEILAIPHLESWGLRDLIGVHPTSVRQAILRVPILLILFTLAGGLAADRIAREGRRRQRAAQSQLAELDLEKKRIEATMLERQKNLAEVGILAAGVAHEINNPVGSILVTAQYARLMQQDPDRARIASEAFATIEKDARRCGHIVHSLLRIASDERSEKSLKDIHSIVHDAVHAAQPYAKERTAELYLEQNHAGATPLLVRPIEMKRAIVNLIRNGIEACEAKARVVVRTRIVPDRVRIEVEDNGRRIPEPDCDCIFEPFHQTRQTYGGSGLGLYEVKRIVDDHGGSVGARSAAVGNGMIFTIELPFDASAKPDRDRSLAL